MGLGRGVFVDVLIDQRGSEQREAKGQQREAHKGTGRGSSDGARRTIRVVTIPPNEAPPRGGKLRPKAQAGGPSERNARTCSDAL